MNQPRRESGLRMLLESPVGGALVVPLVVAGLMWAGSRLFGGVSDSETANAVQAQMLADRDEFRRKQDKDLEHLQSQIDSMRDEMMRLCGRK